MTLELAIQENTAAVRELVAVWAKLTNTAKVITANVEAGTQTATTAGNLEIPLGSPADAARDANIADAAAERAATAEKPKATRAAKPKTEAPAPTAPAETAAPVAALPDPAPAPATVKPSDAETDRAELVALTAGKPELRAKALTMIRRDDANQKFENLPADRRANILDALRSDDL